MTEKNHKKGWQHLPFFSVLIALTLILLALPGCGESGTTPEATAPATGATTTQSTTAPATGTTSPTTAASPATTITLTPDKAETQQMLGEMQLAVDNASSYKFNLNMDIVTEVIGGSEPGRMEMTLASDGVFDTAGNAQMNINMVMDMPSELAEETEVNMEMYVIEDWMYMMMDVPFLGEQWIKMQVDEETAAAYDLNIIDEQLAILESMSEAKSIQEETIDGTVCYVLDLFPDAQTMMQWIQQTGAYTPAELEEMEEIADAFKEFSLKVWIAKDTKVLRKMSLNMTMEILPGQFDGSDADFEKMTMDTSMEMTIYDYNQPVNITLPPEAENAMEIPASGM